HAAHFDVSAAGHGRDSPIPRHLCDEHASTSDCQHSDGQQPRRSEPRKAANRRQGRRNCKSHGEIGGLLPNGEWKSKRERLEARSMASDNPPPDRYTYAQAGVSIDAGNALVKAIGPLVKATRRPGANGEIGGFGGFFDPAAAGYADPLLVAANDGVGTKVKLAIDHDRHDAIGIDLVAMCANDLIVQGAEPLFFLDYFATGKLDTGVAERVIAGIARGCTIAGCALIGGE